MVLRTVLLTLILSTIALPAIAQNDVYDNGPTDGQDWGWTLNYGAIVSNSFTFTNTNNCGYFADSPCSVNGVAFAAWLYPGDVLESAEVSITSSEFGGTSFFDQTLNFSVSGCFTNDDGFNLCTETARFPDVYLNTGTYWLNIQNASVNDYDPIYWDQNSGPSLASQNSLGTIPSESFTILGTPSSSCYYCGTVPEPTGLGWVAAGLLGLLLTASRKSV